MAAYATAVADILAAPQVDHVQHFSGLGLVMFSLATVSGCNDLSCPCYPIDIESNNTLSNQAVVQVRVCTLIIPYNDF